MVNKTFDIELDIKRSSSNQNFEVVEGDNANIIHITLTDNGEAVDLTDCRVLAIFSKSTGTSSQDSAIADNGITITGDDSNEVNIELFTTSFAPGIVECELQVFSGVDLKILATSAKFNFTCRRGILNEDTIESTNEYPLLVDLLDRVGDIEEAEIGRESSEGTRASAETSRGAAEGLRVLAETARGTAEGLRASAETARDTAEGLRASAETARGTAEGLRASSETSRDTAEGLRESAETARDTAEGLRASAETARGTAEGLRATAETARDAAEGLRATAETARGTAEGLRASAETARGTAEGLRVSAETARGTAEGLRASAETARGTAEGLRETSSAAAVSRANDAAAACEGILADFSHAETHASDGADPISPASIGAQATITVSGIVKGDGAGGLSAAAAGTDYQTPLTAGTDYQEPLTEGTDYTAPGLLVTELSLPTSGYTDSKKAFTVTGALTTASKRYLLIPDWSSTAATRALEKTAWNLIDDYEITAADELTITVKSTPATAVSFSLKEVV